MSDFAVSYLGDEICSKVKPNCKTEIREFYSRKFLVWFLGSLSLIFGERTYSISTKHLLPFKLGPIQHSRSSCPEVFLEKGVPEICSKFTRKVISVKLLSNFIEIALKCGCFPVNLLYIFGPPFTINTSGCLLLTLWFVSLLTTDFLQKSWFLGNEEFTSCRRVHEFFSGQLMTLSV